MEKLDTLFIKTYKEIEKDFLRTKEYVEIDQINLNTYSTAYANIILSIGDEICSLINKYKKGCKMIDFLNEISLTCHDSLAKKCVIINDLNWVIASWDINEDETPEWWKIYNKIKHCRFEKDSNGDFYYKKATQKIVLTALSALFLITICCKYNFCKNDIVLLLNKEEDSGYRIEGCSNTMNISILYRVFCQNDLYRDNKYYLLNKGEIVSTNYLSQNVKF